MYNDCSTGIADVDGLLYVPANDLDWKSVNVRTMTDGTPYWNEVTAAILRKVALKSERTPSNRLVLRANAGDYLTVNLYNVF